MLAVVTFLYIANYSLRPTQDGHILEWHGILESVVWWNKIKRKKVVEYFNEERGEIGLFPKLGQTKKER